MPTHRIIGSTDPDKSKITPSATRSDGIIGLNLKTKPSHEIDTVMSPGQRLRHLGLEFCGDGTTRLSMEKYRKVLNLFKYAFKKERASLRRMSRENRTREAIRIAVDVIGNRIRSAAIIDYYLKHVDDERQLREIDIQVMRIVVSAIFDKAFRQRDLAEVTPGQLRAAGLPSVLHRSRLLRHGHQRVDFLSLYNRVKVDRYEAAVIRRRERIDQSRLAKKQKRVDKQ